MRAALILTLALGGCATASPPQTIEPVACTPEAMLETGRHARRYPAHCAGDPALFERYQLGLRIAQLEEELREVNYLIASADGPRLIGGPRRPFYRGFASRGYLISRRVEIKNELRALRRMTGLESPET